MRRDVTARIEATITEPAEMVFSIAVSRENEILSEELTARVGDDAVELTEIGIGHGAVLHRGVDLPTGPIVVEYAATVEGRDVSPSAELDLAEAIAQRNPSRYAPSDRFAAIAADHLGDLTGRDLVQGAADWVYEHLAYVIGSSKVTDGALETYVKRAGVCRDFAHLTIALLRGAGCPARLTSVYAPGLEPMDFHAVVEAYVDDAWWVVDPTRLAPRTAMLRIATGRDAADTAFLNVLGGRVDFGRLKVTATADGELPVDDHTGLVRLG